MELARSEEILAEDGLEVRVAEGLVRMDGRVLPLSVREHELLCALLRRPGRVLAREELYETVWGRPLRPGDRSIDVYVHKLRTKLEDASGGRRFIHTHVGFGYRWTAEPSTAERPS